MTETAQQVNVDVAVIGAGTAGLAAYRTAVSHGKRAVVIESGPYGTTCARVGCMPSKLLIAAAEAAHHAAHMEPFGVSAGPVKVDGRAVMTRVKTERDRFVGFVLAGVEKIPAADKLRGHARFVGPNELDVDGTRVHARAIVVATGSSPVIPPILTDLGDRLIVNDNVFSWDTLPSSLVVFGAGVIGLEIGQALSRLGVRVRVLGRGGSVGPLSDPVVREEARRLLAGEFPVSPDAVVRSVKREGDQVVVEFDEVPGKTLTERFDFAMAAAGRRPNVSGLNLAAAGIALDERGWAKAHHTTMQVGTSHVFVAGDATNELPLLHEAADEGRIAGDNAATFPEVTPGLRRSQLGVVFTDPQMAVVGDSWRTLAGRDDVVVGQIDFGDQGRSRVMRVNRGMLRVYAEAGSGRFLGAEMVGPRAENIGHLLAWSHQQEMTIARMLTMPFYHPVIEEGLRTALRDAQAQLDERRARDAACGR